LNDIFVCKKAGGVDSLFKWCFGKAKRGSLYWRKYW